MLCPSLLSKHSALKPVTSPFLFPQSYSFFICRCCCLCPSRPRYAPSVTIEEDNCCGCNAIAIRRHFLDENMTSVDIVYTSCHDAVRRTPSPLRIWDALLRSFLTDFVCSQGSCGKEGNLRLFLTLELPLLSLHCEILPLEQTKCPKSDRYP